jgi:hypothetical protein
MGGSIQRSRGKVAYRHAADAANKVPVNSVLPAITGTKTQGQTLTASNGTWSRSPSFARQWLRDDAPIAGATNTTYLLAAADVGKLISCRVTATNAGVSASVTSAKTTAIVAA